MRDQQAPGLSVDWLNGWLAAIGVCVLAPQVRLRWTGDAIPTANFLLPEDAPPLAELIADRLPSEESLLRLAIARQLDGLPEFPRKVTLEAYRTRAVAARERGDWSLGCTVTDLATDGDDEGGLPHSPFDPPVPKGLTLHERALSCRRELRDPLAQLTATFEGRPERVASNGLGFDARRLVAGVQDVKKAVDPAVELLAFAALALFPLRGDGRHVVARGWNFPATRKGAFRWCAWREGLDRWAIDALLDLLPAARTDAGLAERLGLSSWYHAVPYRRNSTSDVTTAYAAEAEH